MNNKGIKTFARRFLLCAALAAVLAATAYFINLTVSSNSDDSRAAALSAVGIEAAGLGTVAAVAFIYHMRKSSMRELKNLEHVMQQLGTMVILWDPSFKYIRINDSFKRCTGYSEEDVRNTDTLKAILPACVFSGDGADIKNMGEETVFQTKNGNAVCTVWNTYRVMKINADGEEMSVMMSIGPNLTETVNMREQIDSYSKKLMESESRYALTAELSETGLILKESDCPGYYVSPGLCEMLGLAAENGYVDGNELREAFYPKDRVIFDDFAAGLKGGGEDIRSVDFRARAADGGIKWYKFRYKAIPCQGSDKTRIGGSVIDITRDKEKDIRIERMAYIDEVTGIYNRNKFMSIGNELLDCAKNDGSVNYWVIVIDIDSFHIINDMCGYTVGNRLLREIGAALNSNLTDGGLTARVGGDNFAMIVNSDGSDELPLKLIKRIQKDISSIGGSGLEKQNITCSAGYCLMTDSVRGDFAQVLDRAEFALSLSDGTRSAVTRFDAQAHDSIIAGNEIENELSRAIDNRELALYYQPKINLDNGKVIGMEALIRWIKPDGTVIPPGDFIPVAEKSMLITKISSFVLSEACRQNKKWQDMGFEPITVSINLTAIDFYQANVTQAIRSALEETGLEPQWLDVELTESLALKDIDHAINQMKEIRDLGVKLSMDDFGTGYSSLSYIQILPITLLKLDRSFIMYLEEDEISREIVSAVIRIAKSKQIETIAEGIETVGQAEILKKSGCDQAQGYFFGKPMPADKFEEFLRSRQNPVIVNAE